jgi:hypothetical protein
VNGAAAPVNVWNGQLTGSLSVGTTYSFSAWVAGIYSAAPAQLQFSINNNQIGSTYTLPDTGVWHQITGTFVATASTSTALVDLNTIASGNDFAVDDISLTAVPEPATTIAGALLLLPFAASTLRFVRKNRTA